MVEELKIKDQKQVVQNGFVSYTQEVAALAAQGYVVDIRNKYCPQFMLALFTCNMLLLEDTVDTVAEITTNVAEEATKEKRVYTKSNKAKEALRSKLPAEALQTITK